MWKNKRRQFNLQSSLDTVKKWKERILSIQACTNQYELSLTDKSKRRKPILFLLNPKSGSGKAMTLFKKKILPIIQEADIEHEIIVTTHKNHGKELIMTNNLLQWGSIVIGD